MIDETVDYCLFNIRDCHFLWCGARKGEPLEEGGVPIYIADYGFHTAVYLQVSAFASNSDPKAQTIAKRYADAQMLEIGWGDREFYMVMGGFENFELSTGIKAFFMPTPSVMQIVPIYDEVPVYLGDIDWLKLELSENSLDAIIKQLMTGMKNSDSIAPSRYGSGHFYDGNGKYTFINTCNHFMSRALRAGGIASSPILSNHSTPLLWELSKRYGGGTIPR